MNGFGRGGDPQKKDKLSVITRETVGMTLLLFSAIAFLIAVTGGLIFGDIGVAITSFFVGAFGLLAYPLLLVLIYASVVLVGGKKLIPAKWILRVGALVLSVFLIVHTATAEPFYGSGYGAYLSCCWGAASVRALDGTGGGVLLGLIAYPVRALLSPAGAYVLYALFTILSLYFIALGTPLRQYIGVSVRRHERKQPRAEGERTAAPVAFDDLSVPERQPMPVAQPEPEPRYEAPREEARPVHAASEARNEAYYRSKDILFSTDPATSYRENLIFDNDSYFNSNPRNSSMRPAQTAAPAAPRPQETVRKEPPSSYTSGYAAQAETPRPPMPRRVTEVPARERGEQSRTDAVLSDDAINYPQVPTFRAPAAPASHAEHDYYVNDVPTGEFSSAPNVHDDPVPPAPPAAVPVRRAEPAPEAEPDPAAQSREKEVQFRGLFSRPASGGMKTEIPMPPARPAEPTEDTLSERINRAAGETPSPSRVFESPMRSGGSDSGLFDGDDVEEDPAPAPEAVSRVRTGGRERVQEAPTFDAPDNTPAPTPKKHVYKAYRRPDYNIFQTYDDVVSVPQEEIKRNSDTIVETLAGFRVNAEIVKVTCGPAVTRYDIDIPGNIPVRSVIKYDEEIAMRLHARDGVNIYSNSEVGAVSIEVPNAVPAIVGLRSLLDAPEYVNAKPTALMFAIGKDVEGRNVCGNIVKMKHILVAGATGSGKSVCLNAMLISLICKYSPEELRLILIDPKKVEFAVYDGLPHLMINEIISDAQKAVSALNWAIKEMERRYLLFEQKTRSGTLVHNIDEYNAALGEGEEKLCKIVIVVDELADLMSVAKKDIEDRVQRIAQKARAAGMHLVIATQRPSVDVITGVIKGNLPTRMAFRVIQEVDSRTIIDSSGAEKLLGNGDMLYRTESMYGCLRVQGAFLSADEVQKVVSRVKAENEAYFDESVADFINRNEAETGVVAGGDGDDGSSINPEYVKALGIVVALGSASISLIQRKCSVGYNHAGKIIEWMELMGYISPFDGKAKARTVLLTKEEFEEKYGGVE